MSRISQAVWCCVVACVVAKGQSPAQPEAIPPDRLAGAHKTLFEPVKPNEAGAITERVSPSSAVKSRAGKTARRNFIDNHIFDRMDRDRVPHAPLAGDHEFLRRVTLDLTGRIPSPAETRDFVMSTDPARRDKAVDRLLETEAYVEKWSYFFMDLFRANGKMGRGQQLFHYWMKENLRVDRPYSDVARSIIAASAKSNHVVAASNVIAREHVQGKPQPDDGRDFGMVHQLDTHDELAVLYGKTFLGINLSCISCHDGQGHLEKVNTWLSGKKRSEFFQFASFLGNSRYLMYWEDGKPQSGEFMIDDANPGYNTKGASMIRVRRFGGASDPAFIMTGERPRDGEEPREALGRMLTSHPQFARAAVNMFWAKLMGFGLVEPFDEFDLAKPDQAFHRELLDALAANFETRKYSIRTLLATIAKSNAYRLSSRFEGDWKDSYTRYFARKYVRLLSAEELHDAIALATQRPASFSYGGEKMGMAMQLSGPAGGKDIRNFMQTFGQSNRSNPPRPSNGSVMQPLLLMQSPVVNARVLAEKDSRVEQLVNTYKDNPGRVVDELFLATLTRPASAAEREVAMGALKRDLVSGAQDLHWALINNVEFFFNH